MSGYENAPATLLVASHCVACGLPLVDSISVNTGMGPTCREKYGAIVEGVTAEAQADVNARVYQLAAGVPAAEVIGHLVIIRAYGFTKLADKLEERLCAIEIEPLDVGGFDHIAISAPYSDAFAAELSTVAGRRWCKATKRWLAPATKSARDAVWAALRRCFPGAIGKGGEAGFFVVKPIA